MVNPIPNKGIFMKISKNHVVTIEYTLKNDNGDTLDTSNNGDPLIYIQGLGHMIPGLENEIDGKINGDKFNVTILPEDGYGVRKEDLIETVPKSQFQDSDKLEKGMQFQVPTDHGHMIVTVSDVLENDVVVDGNHPLAGVTLHFDVEIKDVREATESELSAGHIHSSDCNHN